MHMQYLPVQVNSAGVMPIIFSTSLLAIPGSVARFTGVEALKSLAIALYPGGKGRNSENELVF